MSRYFYDTEFLEDGKTVELISLGMIAEDGREFYGVNRDAPWQRIAGHPWLMANVVGSLPVSIHRDPQDVYAFTVIEQGHADCGAVMGRNDIVTGVLDLIGDDPAPQLWAYYAAYDHLALCQLWGRMLDLPDNMPKWTHELMQERERWGNPALPEQAAGQHNALEDARWNREAFLWLQQQNPVIEQ